jgi:hypothetical protein
MEKSLEKAYKHFTARLHGKKAKKKEEEKACTIKEENCI